MPDTQSPAEPTTDEAVENGPGESEQGAAKYGPECNEECSEEYGGPKGLEPTRYGDWEKNGRCIDF